MFIALWVLGILAFVLALAAAFALAYNVSLTRVLLAYQTEHERVVCERLRIDTVEAIRAYLATLTKTDRVDIGAIVRIVRYGAADRDRDEKQAIHTTAPTAPTAPPTTMPPTAPVSPQRAAAAKKNAANN